LLVQFAHDYLRRCEARNKSFQAWYDLAECESVFDTPMLTREDAREAYGEMRLQSLCWLNGRVAVLAWTDREAGPHLISCRYGDKQETRGYIKAVL